MRKYLWIGLFMMACLAFAGNGSNPQKKAFNGIITDLVGNPIKGARIWVIDNMYSKSDKLGRFGLTNVQATDTLHIKYNKKQYDIPVDGRQSIRVHLGDELVSEEDTELANIGYGFVKRREKTVPSSGVTGEMLIRTGKTDILKALDGLIPGYTLVNGSPIIRGKSSLNLSNEPLYILDGTVVNSLDFVSVYDVDHVEVLKEASIYGSRGANGAIIVTTKRGR